MIFLVLGAGLLMAVAMPAVFFLNAKQTDAKAEHLAQLEQAPLPESLQVYRNTTVLVLLMGLGLTLAALGLIDLIINCISHHELTIFGTAMLLLGGLLFVHALKGHSRNQQGKPPYLRIDAKGITVRENSIIAWDEVIALDFEYFSSRGPVDTYMLLSLSSPRSISGGGRLFYMIHRLFDLRFPISDELIETISLINISTELDVVKALTHRYFCEARKMPCKPKASPAPAPHHP